MASTTLEKAAAAPPPAGSRTKSRGPLRPIGSALTEAGEMTLLLCSVIAMAVRNPRGYWGEVRDQMYDILKLCWIPMAVSCTAFGLGAPGLLDLVALAFGVVGGYIAAVPIQGASSGAFFASFFANDGSCARARAHRHPGAAGRT